MAFALGFLVAALLLSWLYKWYRDPTRRMPDGTRKLPGPWSKFWFSVSCIQDTVYVWNWRLGSGNVCSQESLAIPFIGRVHDIPPERTWLHFYRWSQQFGPIYRHELFGTTHVWITSEEIAKDLLAKQASIFSDRPLINNLPINKTGGEYLPLLGANGVIFGGSA